MPLSLVPPGKRKGNQFYLVRGKVGGRDIEVSTKSTNEIVAKRFALELELKLLEDSPPELGEDVTFARAAQIYQAWRDPRDVDLKRIKKLNVILGAKLLTAVTLSELHHAANQLHPHGAPATKNREVLRPAAAILHHAAESGLCAYVKVKLFREPRPKTRGVSQDVAKALVSSLPPMPEYKRQRTEKWLAAAAVRQRKKALLLLWLFRQGPRISDALAIRVAGIDMARRRVSRHIGKTDEDVVEALHDEVWEALANDPPAGAWLFPWRTKSGVYKWLGPYCRQLGINFTPHMARHSLGKWLNESGASLRTIMDTLHHADPKSSIRYQSTDMEVIRENGRKLGKISGK